MSEQSGRRNVADSGMLLVLVGAVFVLASDPPDWIWVAEAAALVLNAAVWLWVRR